MISKNDFNAYRRVQMSGITNMFDVKTVMACSGLTRNKCLDIMKKYLIYEENFGKFKDHKSAKRLRKSIGVH